MKRLGVLFWELFRLSLFVVGGGYAMLAVADETFARRGWTREGELVDNLPVMQMVPGLIATHTAVYVGSRVAGAFGALVGVAAVALPSVAIFTCVSMGYGSIPVGSPVLASAFAGLRAALVGIVAATVVRSWRKSLVDALSSVVMAACAVGVGLFGVPVAAAAAASAGAGLAVQFSRRGPEGGAVFRCSWLPLLLFLKYGALCFGGGFVLVPMYLEDFVGPAAPYLQIAADEFANLMALTQMTPGPIGVNGATFFGYRMCGVAGAVAASALLLLPGSVLAFAAYRSLERFRSHPVVLGLMRGMRPASVGLMLVALWSFAKLAFCAPSGAGWCIVEPPGINLAAVALAAATAAAVLARRLGAVQAIAASAALAVLVRA